MSRFAAILTRSSRDAKDLVQAACERTLCRASQWSPETQFDNWVFRIMQTIWDNELRARRVRARYLEESVRRAEDELAGDGEQIAQSWITLDEVERLARARLNLMEVLESRGQGTADNVRELAKCRR
jgi:RNA polymerase sigma-70 factor (ECF subfamily)